MEHHSLLKEAFVRLFPNRDPEDSHFIVKYTAKFSDYNANIKRSSRFSGKTTYEVRLSRQWQDVSDDIVIGMIQNLLLRLEKVKRKEKTLEMSLYEKFLKNVHIAVPKTRQDPFLSDVFDRVNEKYFNGLIEKPNLVWGEESKRKLGSYEFGTDTIAISSVFRKCINTPDEVFIDSVMHHEMLHKKLKFSTTARRSRYHSTEFRKKEREFENYPEIEKRIQRFLRERRKFFLFQ